MRAAQMRLPGHGGRVVEDPPCGLELKRRHRIRVSGSMDTRSASELEALVRRICVRGGEIELDLREVGFIDSAGLRALLNAKALCAEHCATLTLYACAE